MTTSFYVQLLSEGRRPDGPSIDLLIVIVVSIGLPVLIQIEAVDAGIS